MKQMEVTSINKQKFLAELGKLLTFMYEEDRVRAIELYSRMFDEAGDEMALLQALVSPTRQAVVVACAYNSNLGKLSLTAASKAAPEDRDDNGVPDYVQAIEKVRAEAWTVPGVSPAPKSAGKPAAEEAAEPETAEAEETEAAETEEAEPEKAEEAEAAETEEAETEKAEEAETEEAEEPEVEKAEEPEVEKAEEPEKAEEAGEPQEVPAAGPAEEEKPAKLEGIEIFTMPEAGRETPLSETGAGALDENSFNIDSTALRRRRKPRVFLLILYILLAIPLTLCAVVVLLVPALLFLALAVAAIICGVVLVTTAVSNLAAMGLINDCLVMLGLALVLFALGLLFLWTAIWFIGGAIVGVIHGVAALCDKWCYKEVDEA